MLSQLDKLVPPLEKTLTARLKSDAVKQEVSRTAQRSMAEHVWTWQGT